MSSTRTTTTTLPRSQKAVVQMKIRTLDFRKVTRAQLHEIEQLVARRLSALIPTNGWGESAMHLSLVHAKPLNGDCAMSSRLGTLAGGHECGRNHFTTAFLSNEVQAVIMKDTANVSHIEDAVLKDRHLDPKECSVHLWLCSSSGSWCTFASHPEGSGQAESPDSAGTLICATTSWRPSGLLPSEDELATWRNAVREALAGVSLCVAVFVGLHIFGVIPRKVLLCLGLTFAVVLGLAFYALSTELDLSSMGPYVLYGLLALFGTAFIVSIVVSLGLSTVQAARQLLPSGFRLKLPSLAFRSRPESPGDTRVPRLPTVSGGNAPAPASSQGSPPAHGDFSAARSNSGRRLGRGFPPGYEPLRIEYG
jgi:hypothetical protein